MHKMLGVSTQEGISRSVATLVLGMAIAPADQEEWVCEPSIAPGGGGRHPRRVSLENGNFYVPKELRQLALAHREDVGGPFGDSCEHGTIENEPMGGLVEALLKP